MSDPLTVDQDFPGGNIVVDAIDGDTVYVHQDLRGTVHDWFYWCLRLRGAAGRVLTFRFTAGPAIGVRGPAMSCDDGWTWRWLGADAVLDNGFVCRLPAGVDDCRLAMAMPYQVAQWERFIALYAGRPQVRRETLCVSAHGRPVEMVFLDAAAGPRHRVAVTCRHHCCEMMANYALEGLIAWWLTAAEAEAEWLRTHATLLTVPFIDVDGVEEGDQGKDRSPRDHGRDYLGPAVHAATAAIRAQLPAWADGRLRVALDLHCPWLRGDLNEMIYLVGSVDERIARAQRGFSHILAQQHRGPLPFRVEDHVPFGTAWNTAANYGSGRSLARWVGDELGVDLAAIVELPYANAGGVAVDQTSARSFGADLGRGIAFYLRALDG